jgi:hypothetical protein
MTNVICFVCKEPGEEGMLRSIVSGRRHMDPWYHCGKCHTHVCDRCETKLDRTEPIPSKFLWWTSMSSSPKCPKCGRPGLTRPYYGTP